MEFCDVCAEEVDNGETYTCSKCGISFCVDCGDPASQVCAECIQYVAEQEARTKLVNEIDVANAEIYKNAERK